MKFFTEMIREFGPIEWLVVWFVLVAPPVIAFGVAISGFRKKEVGVGTAALVIGMIFGGLLGLLLWNYGAQMVQMTVTSAGVFVIGILLVAAFCLAIYPVSLVGSQLRAAFEYRRRSYWVERGRKSFLIGFGGLLALGAVGGVIYRIGNPMTAAIFGIIALGILVLGWFGRFLVPEV